VRSAKPGVASSAKNGSKGPGKSARPSAKSRQVAAEAKSGVKVKANPAQGAKPAKPAPQGREAAAGTAAKATQSTIVLPDNYRPSETEPFMSPMQRQYFRMKLVNWKEEILRQTRETLQGMHDETTQYADLADRATSETDRALELRARDRQRKLISKIDAALARIEDGTYGYCEETGEPIGLKRLDARPIATLSLEAQERHERREKVHRGD
jgi:DnaK suppressor protein